MTHASYSPRAPDCAPTLAATANASLRRPGSCSPSERPDVQMDDVARRAGVGVGTVYRHFPDKEALMGELVRQRFWPSTGVSGRRSADTPRRGLRRSRQTLHTNAASVAEDAATRFAFMSGGEGVFAHAAVEMARVHARRQRARRTRSPRRGTAGGLPGRRDPDGHVRDVRDDRREQARLGLATPPRPDPPREYNHRGTAEPVDVATPVVPADEGRGHDFEIAICNLKEGRGGRRYAPYVFTEQGVAMLSGVLRSKTAVAVNIAIMRAFVELRRAAASFTPRSRDVSKISSERPGRDSASMISS